MRNIGNFFEDRKIRFEIKFRKGVLGFYKGDVKLVFDNKEKFKNIFRSCSYLMVKSSYF